MSISALNHVNVSFVVGTLINEPSNKVLKSGDVVTSFLVKVKPETGPVSTVPVSWLNAPDESLDFEVGDVLIVHGQVRQQWYSPSERFTDLLADDVQKAGRPSVMRKALTKALVQLQEIAS